jgi:hypothetical protein
MQLAVYKVKDLQFYLTQYNMKATNDGFVYNEQKEVVAEIFKGDGVAIPVTHAIFYGTKQEALDYGLIFQEDLQPNE